MWRGGTARERHPQRQRAGIRALRSQLGSQALTSARVPGSRGTHSTSSGSSSDLMGDLVAADQSDDKVGVGGGQFLSSGCPQPAPCPTAARSRVPTCFPSAGDTVTSMGSGQRAAPRPGPPALGGGRARLQPGRSPAGAAASRWAHLLLSPQVRVLRGDSAAGPERAAAGRAAGCGGRLAARRALTGLAAARALPGWSPLWHRRQLRELGREGRRSGGEETGLG